MEKETNIELDYHDFLWKFCQYKAATTMRMQKDQAVASHLSPFLSQSTVISDPNVSVSNPYIWECKNGNKMKLAVTDQGYVGKIWTLQVTQFWVRWGINSQNNSK